ncbi:MAG: hypothetical protein ACRDZR_05195 [Acidimicrobiales bacterium]
MALLAHYSTRALRPWEAGEPVFVGTPLLAQEHGVCPACTTSVVVGDRVARVAVAGRWWVVHEECAAPVTVG